MATGTGRIRGSHLFLAGCLLSLVHSRAGQTLPARNFSLSWEDEFCAVLTWLPPKDLQSCCYYLVQHPATGTEELAKGKETEYISRRQSETRHRELVTMGGGFLKYSLRAACLSADQEGDPAHAGYPCEYTVEEGDPAFVNITSPELAEDFECFLLSSDATSCSWRPASGATDFQLFFRSAKVTSASVPSADGCSALSALKECPDYQYTGAARTGCNLHGGFFHHLIYFLLNGTLGDSPVRNIYLKDMMYNVRLNPLQWDVRRDEDFLIISWTPPDGVSGWTYEVNYTECGKMKRKEVNEREGHSTKLVYTDRCEYRITVAAYLHNRIGWTLPGEEERYGKNSNPNQLLYVTTIIIPVVLAAVLAIFLVCCQRHKEKLFPKVPEPRDLLGGIVHNNNENHTWKMYVLAEEEQDSMISFAVEQEHKKSVS